MKYLSVCLCVCMCVYVCVRRLVVVDIGTRSSGEGYQPRQMIGCCDTVEKGRRRGGIAIKRARLDGCRARDAISYQRGS